MDYLKMIEPLVRSKEYRDGLKLPNEVTETYEMLANGEYNVNLVFTHQITKKKMVLRINEGSQMGLDNQIEYEANVLKFLEKSGRTPKLYYVDSSKKYIDKGILVMEFLDGISLDYKKDLYRATDILVDIHRQEIGKGLIRASEGFSFILDECESMLKKYLNSEFVIKDKAERLRNLLDKGWKMQECFIPDKRLHKCIINTELNSTNFLINNKKDYLIDWEKAVAGLPAQDIGHFLAPTSTFWKTDIILTEAEIKEFIEKYIEKAEKYFDVTGIRETSFSFIKINCLRGLTWCAMAYVQYKKSNKILINDSTRLKLDAYLSDNFIGKIEEIFN